MAGAWSAQVGDANTQSLGAVLSTSFGTAVTSGAAQAKGSWTTIITAAPYDITLLTYGINIYNPSGYTIALDIGVGPAGSEVAIIQNLVCDIYLYGQAVIPIPCNIPAGSRVAVRMASQASAADTTYLCMTAYDSSWWDDGPNGIVTDTYGFQASGVHGTSVDPGATANTKGAWSQLAAATSFDLAGFFCTFDAAGQTSGGTTSTPSRPMLIDIGMGPSGSQLVLASNLYTNRYFYSTNYDYGCAPQNTPWLWTPIPAGSALWARAQTSFTTATDRLIGVTLYGMRQ